jgi:hypothetical protein
MCRKAVQLMVFLHFAAQSISDLKIIGKLNTAVGIIPGSISEIRIITQLNQSKMHAGPPRCKFKEICATNLN